MFAVRAMLVVPVVALIALATFGSALPVAADTVRDQQCRDFVTNVTNNNLGFSTRDIEILSGCRLDADGEWFWPESARDPRLVGPPILDDYLREQTMAWRQPLVADLADFLSWMQSMPDHLNAADRAKSSLWHAFLEFQPGAIEAWWGVGPKYSLGAPAVPARYEVYARVIQTFVTDPDRYAMRDYVAWWIARRSSTRPVDMGMRMVPPAAAAFEYHLAFERWPWPWELKRSLNIDEYLAWRAKTLGLTNDVGRSTATSVASNSREAATLIIEVTDVDGRPVGGACFLGWPRAYGFRACDNNEGDPITVQDADSRPGWIVLDLRASQYTITESAAPPGYVLVNPSRGDISIDLQYRNSLTIKFVYARV